MKERGVKNHFKSLATRSLGLDARSNAEQTEPDADPITLRIQTLIVWFYTVSMPALGRVISEWELQSGIDTPDTYTELPRFKSTLGPGVLDVMGWMGTLYISKHSPDTNIFAERLATNVGTHLGLDSISYAWQRAKRKWYDPRKEARDAKIAERIRCSGDIDLL